MDPPQKKEKPQNVYNKFSLLPFILLALATSVLTSIETIHWWMAVGS